MKLTNILLTLILISSVLTLYMVWSMSNAAVDINTSEAGRSIGGEGGFTN